MEDRSGQILAIAITFLILTWLTVGLRCYVRLVMVKGFGADDYTMVITLVLFTGYLIAQIGGSTYGIGVSREKLTDANAEAALHFWFFCEIFYTLSTCFLKISVGLFLLRITIVQLHIWIIRIIMVVSGIVGIAYTSVAIFQCKPVSYWWNLSPDHDGTCISPTIIMIFTFVVSGLNACADWIFAILPVLIVQGLHMKTRMKFIVAGVIALAAIGSTATIIRLPYTTSLGGYKGDFLYTTTDFAIWSTVEVGLGVAAGSIATLRPLLKQAFEVTRSASAMPWSKPSLKSDQQLSGQQLSTLRPAIQKSITITTSRARRESAESDEERFLGTGMPSEAWQQQQRQQQGLPGYITSTVLDERTARITETSRKQKREPARGGSPGSASQSTIDSKESGKAPRIHVHERF